MWLLCYSLKTIVFMIIKGASWSCIHGFTSPLLGPPSPHICHPHAPQPELNAVHTILSAFWTYLDLFLKPDRQSLCQGMWHCDKVLLCMKNHITVTVHCMLTCFPTQFVQHKHSNFHWRPLLKLLVCLNNFSTISRGEKENCSFGREEIGMMTMVPARTIEPWFCARTCRLEIHSGKSPFKIFIFFW